MATSADIIQVATDVAEALRSAATITYHGRFFRKIYRDQDGKIKGMCSKFCRMVFEVATDKPSHSYPQYFGNSALHTGQLMAAMDKAVTSPQPGDFAVLRGGDYGHIVILLPDGKMAENTSSTRRGRGPGTVISNFSAVEHRVIGYYRLLPPAPLKVVLLPGSKVIACRPRLEDNVTRVDLRALATALDYEVYDHIADQNKIYLRRGGDTDA